MSVAESRGFHERALGLRAEGRPAEAEELAGQAFKLLSRQLDPDDPGVLHKYQGRYDDAEPVYRRALAIVEAALGPEHPR